MFWKTYTQSKINPRKIVSISVLGFLFCANIAMAQDILPRQPSGPSVKAPINEQPLAKTPTIGEMARAARMYRSHDFRGALLLATSLADRGDANAMALTAFIHEKGLAGTPDYVKAANYYRRAAAMNSDDAMLGLGRMARDGHGNISGAEAKTALENALIRGRTDARFMLANILYFDEINPDKNRGFDLFKLEAQNGTSEAAYICGIILLDKQPETNENLIQAAQYMRQAAEANLPEAQAKYGVFNYLGSAIPKNHIEAAKWFQKSAQNNEPDGMFYWALVNAKGEGVSRNLETARLYAGRAKDLDGETKADALKLWQKLEDIRLHPSQTTRAAPKAKRQ